MEAAENSYNLIQDYVYFLESLLFKTNFKLTIRENNDVMWCKLASIHEFLERSVSSFLEEHIVIERVNDQIINLLFKR